jgi:hypothetical protein
MTNTKSRQRLTAIALLAIISLLIVNAVLLYNKYKQDKIIHDKNERINEISDIRSDLEKEYYEALSELEGMRGDNAKMNAVIDEQKNDLKVQKERIIKLIKDSDDLNKARIEMQKLRTTVDRYIQEVSKLEAENRTLKDSTNALREDRMLLTQKIAEERHVNDELKSVKATLTEEKESLSEENVTLMNKVSRASVIDVAKIQVEGFRYGANGSERGRKKAKNIEVLKICFDAQPNNVAELGAEQFYIRIIDPLGETLAIENLGSGVLQNDMNNTRVRYTRSTEIEYQRETQTACVAWEPNLPFKEGEYLVEVYNKGFLSGSTVFNLN